MKSKTRITLKRIVNNNLFMLKTIHRAVPSYVFIFLLLPVVEALIGFFSGTFLLRLVVSTANGESSFSFFFIFLFVVTVVQFTITMFHEKWLYEIQKPILDQKLVSKIQKSMFNKVAKVEIACYENPKFYDQYIQAQDEAFSRAMNVLNSIADFLAYITTMSVNVLLIFSIDPHLMIWCVFPIAEFFLRQKQKEIKYSYDIEMRQINRKKRYVEHTFYLKDYAKEMRLSNIWRLMFQKQKNIYYDQRNIIQKYGVKQTTIDFILSSLEKISTLSVLFYAILSALILNTMSIADCVVILTSFGLINQSLSNLIANVMNFYENALYIEDYRYFINYQPQIKQNIDGLVAHKGELKIEHLSFRYSKESKPILKNINLYIKPGEKIALVGKNGSGKTTLIKLLLHLYEPDEGIISLNGIDIKQYSLESYRTQFSIVPQDIKSFSLSIAENIMLHPIKEGDKKNILESIKKSGIKDKIDKLEHGIDTILTRELDKNGVILSDGENQMINLARVFLESDKPFVILDEPSSSLDPIAEFNMFNNMIEACSERSVIFISHRMTSAMLADRIYLFDNGEIIEEGSHENLMDNNGAYAKLFRMQASGYDQKTEDKFKTNI